MKGQLIAPVKEVHGAITDGYYARVLNKKQIFQRKPHFTKPPTEKQLSARAAFGQKYGTGRKKDG